MNKVIIKKLLVGDNFMLELQRQPGFIYSACRPLNKNHTRIKELRKADHLKHIYKSTLDKVCFSHDAAYSDSKDLAKITIYDKILKDRAYEIAINPEYDRYQRGFASMVYKFFDKKTGLGASVNEKLAQELRKPVIKQFKRKKVYTRFIDNIWAADLSKMVSLSSKNLGVKYLLFTINLFTKNAWIKPLKDKKSKIVLNHFIKIANKCNSKQINYDLIKEENFTIALCKNG